VNFFHLTDLSVPSVEGEEKSVEGKKASTSFGRKRNERKGKKRKEKEMKDLTFGAES
jgi:hypothetical protein